MFSCSLYKTPHPTSWLSAIQRKTYIVFQTRTRHIMLSPSVRSVSDYGLSRNGETRDTEVEPSAGQNISNASAKEANSTPDDDDWGVVVKKVESNDYANELEETGILILPPGEHEELNLESHLSSVDVIKDMTETAPVLQVPPPDFDEEINFSLPGYNDIPSDLESLDAPNGPSLASKKDLPAEQVTVFPGKDESSRLSSQDEQKAEGEDITNEEKSKAEKALSEELAMVDAIFRAKTNSFMHQKNILVMTAVVIAVVTLGGVAMFTMERRARSRLEKRIEQLQVELLHKMEHEKIQDMQRQVEFATLKKEFKQALMEREKSNAQAQHFILQPQAQPRPLPTVELPIADNADKKNCGIGSEHQIDSCWIQAEAKLGECAQETRNAFRSKLQTLGRSLWNAQETIVEKVNDFGKSVHKAAKETAERVVVEMKTTDWAAQGGKRNQTFLQTSAHMHFSHPFFHSHLSKSVNATERTTNFRNVATSFVSSVALAGVATVLVDKAATYIAALSDEQQD